MIPAKKTYPRRSAAQERARLSQAARRSVSPHPETQYSASAGGGSRASANQSYERSSEPPRPRAQMPGYSLPRSCYQGVETREQAEQQALLTEDDEVMRRLAADDDLETEKERIADLAPEQISTAIHHELDADKTPSPEGTPTPDPMAKSAAKTESKKPAKAALKAETKSLPTDTKIEPLAKNPASRKKSQSPALQEENPFAWVQPEPEAKPASEQSEPVQFRISIFE